MLHALHDGVAARSAAHIEGISMHNRVLRITLAVVTAFQLALGVGFLVAPGPFSASLGLAPAPEWTYWMFPMFSARAFGFAYGMVLAFRDPVKHRSWITAMIGVQAIDWIATMAFIAAGAITLSQATTAAFMPVLFIAGLVWGFPRQTAAENSDSSQPVALAVPAR